jgi:hypothetical protein
MSRIRAASFAGFVAVLTFIGGCSVDATVEVKGTVRYDGQPIAEGAINFIPIDGMTSTAGGLIKDGAYSVKVPPGVMKVTITSIKETGESKKLYDAPESPKRPIRAQVLPDKYAHREQTELQYEVKPGINVKDWDLEK